MTKIKLVRNMTPVARGYMEAVMSTALTASGNLPPYMRSGQEFLVDDQDMAAYSSKAALLQAVKTAEVFMQFVEPCCPALKQEVEENQRHAGMDLFYTIGGHGVGFWDGDWQHGDDLTEICRLFVEKSSEFYHGLVRIENS